MKHYFLQETSALENFKYCNSLWTSFFFKEACLYFFLGDHYSLQYSWPPPWPLTTAIPVYYNRYHKATTTVAPCPTIGPCSMTTTSPTTTINSTTTIRPEPPTLHSPRPPPLYYHDHHTSSTTITMTNNPTATYEYNTTIVVYCSGTTTTTTCQSKRAVHSF